MRQIWYILSEHEYMKHWMNLRLFWRQSNFVSNFSLTLQDLKGTNVPRAKLPSPAKSHYTFGRRDFEKYMVSNFKLHCSSFLVSIAFLPALGS